MWYGSHEAKIRQLEDDLRRAQSAIVTLLPQPIRELAETYINIENRQQARAWEWELIDAIVELALPVPEESAYSEPRTPCPLCRSRGAGLYMEGFLLPDGLRKHLLGKGNAHPCEVLTPVRDLARDFWMPRVTEAEERERAAAEAEKKLRRTREDQFLVDPREPPLLRDESLLLFGSRPPRDDESLAWAEARLLQLGFSELRTGWTRQFTKEHDDWVVFADPRELGRLSFMVFRKEQLEKPKSRRRREPDHASFEMLDTLRNDLNKKFETRFEEAKQSLTRKPKR